MRSDGSGWVFSDLDTVLDQLEIGVHEAHAGVVGLCAGVALLGVSFGTVGDLLVRLIRVIHLSSGTGQLNMDLVDIEAMLRIVESELLEDALQIAVGHRVIGILPLLVLLHELLIGVDLLGTVGAVGHQVVVGLHHIGFVVVVMVIVFVIREGQGQTQKENYEDLHRDVFFTLSQLQLHSVPSSATVFIAEA